MELLPEYSRLFGYMDARDWDEASIQTVCLQESHTTNYKSTKGSWTEAHRMLGKEPRMATEPS